MVAFGSMCLCVYARESGEGVWGELTEKVKKGVHFIWLIYNYRGRWLENSVCLCLTMHQICTYSMYVCSCVHASSTL